MDIHLESKMTGYYPSFQKKQTKLFIIITNYTMEALVTIKESQNSIRRYQMYILTATIKMHNV